DDRVHRGSGYDRPVEDEGELVQRLLLAVQALADVPEGVTPGVVEGDLHVPAAVVLRDERLRVRHGGTVHLDRAEDVLCRAGGVARDQRLIGGRFGWVAGRVGAVVREVLRLQSGGDPGRIRTVGRLDGGRGLQA